MPIMIMTENEIGDAKKKGYTVKDLNTAFTTVRGPNWMLVNPSGETVGYGWTEADAWRKIFPIRHLEEMSAIAKVIAERQRQDAKWGKQNHDAGKWFLILAKELGEVAKSQLEGDRANYLTELVQSAAVLVAWIECELRKES